MEKLLEFFASVERLMAVIPAHALPPAAVWLLVPAMCFADGLAGGRPKVPGRGVWWAVPPLCLLFGFLGHGFIASLAFAMAFYAWRDISPSQFGGKLDSRTERELAGTLLRHAPAVGMLLTILLPKLFAGVPIPLHVMAPVAFPFIATGISRLLGAIYESREWRMQAGLPVGPDVANDYAEWARGAILGALLAISLGGLAALAPAS